MSKYFHFGGIIFKRNLFNRKHFLLFSRGIAMMELCKDLKKYLYTKLISSTNIQYITLNKKIYKLLAYNTKYLVLRGHSLNYKIILTILFVNTYENVKDVLQNRILVLYCWLPVSALKCQP